MNMMDDSLYRDFARVGRLQHWAVGVGEARGVASLPCLCGVAPHHGTSL